MSNFLIKKLIFRFSQTLMHIKNVHWVVIEDGNTTVPAVERILQRSHIPYVYFYTTTKPGFPRLLFEFTYFTIILEFRRGWTHRNMGLEYIRKNYRNYKRNAVVYFADDDNSYDIRLFDRYIRHVKTIGVWAVGLAGGALVEAPHVENGTIVYVFIKLNLYVRVFFIKDCYLMLKFY